MHKPSSLKDYTVACFLGVVSTGVVLVYLFARRGELNQYVFNQALASASVFLLALVFLIGPLMRYVSWGGYYVRYRKEVGIVGGVLAILHGVISLLFLPEWFPLASYADRLDTFIPGMIGTLMLGYLIWISRQKEIIRLGGRIWWALQRWGLRVVIAAALIHVIVMKLSRWKRWWLQGESSDYDLPGFPPMGLLATSALVVVVAIRMIEYLIFYPHRGVSIHASSGQEQGPLAEHEPAPSGHAHFSRSRLMRWVVAIASLTLLAWFVWLFAHGARF